MFISNIVLRGKNIALENKKPEAVEKIVEKKIEVPVEVEKIVYKDNPETLEELETYKSATSLLSEGYITMFDIAEMSADMFGQPIHQDWYDLYQVALAFL